VAAEPWEYATACLGKEITRRRTPPVSRKESKPNGERGVSLRTGNAGRASGTSVL